jgi:hypothetical protein
MECPSRRPMRRARTARLPVQIIRHMFGSHKEYHPVFLILQPARCTLVTTAQTFVIRAFIEQTQDNSPRYIKLKNFEKIDW